MRRLGVRLQAVEHLLRPQSLDEVRQPLDVGRLVEQVHAAILPPALEHGLAQHHQLVDLHALAARSRQHVRRTSRALASIAGKAEDRVAYDEQAARARAVHGVLELRHRVQAVDLEQARIVGALEPELDPHGEALVPAREHVERLAAVVGAVALWGTLPIAMGVGLLLSFAFAAFLLLGRRTPTVIFVSLGTLTGAYAAERLVSGWQYVGASPYSQKPKASTHSQTIGLKPS